MGFRAYKVQEYVPRSNSLQFLEFDSVTIGLLQAGVCMCTLPIGPIVVPFGGLNYYGADG